MRLIFGVLILPLTAYAVEDQEIATCAAIENDLTRLACFDSVASSNSLAPRVEQKEVKDAGQWIINTDVDPLNDENIHYAILPASEGESRYRKPISLTVRCSKSNTELYINWNDFLGREAVTALRVDKDKAATKSWSLSTDKQSAFYPGSPVKILKRIAESSTVVANVTPYNSSPVTAVFDTSGANVAFTDIRKACNW